VQQLIHCIDNKKKKLNIEEKGTLEPVETQQLCGRLASSVDDPSLLSSTL